MTSQFRNIPSVSGVLAHPRVGGLLARFSREAVTGLVRDALAAARDEVRDGADAPTVSQVADAVAESAAARWMSWPRRVVNATGVVLHTNLGRAPLSAESLRAVEMAASGYSDLEFDLAAGKRGSRQARIADLIRQATGAEAGLAVNNNASAVTLALAAVAAGKEVVVSRGEAVEIGGGFRIPDVLAQSGARLVEVGTTNRAYARDFENAIGADTGAILSVHASNFRVIGFTHAPTLRELVEVGERRGVPVLHDLGSGCLLDTRPYGLAPEPMPQRSAADGAALAFFSGDKMLGGASGGRHRGQARVGGARGEPSAGARRPHRQAEHGGAVGYPSPLHSRRGDREGSDMADDFRSARRADGARGTVARSGGGRMGVRDANAVDDRRRQPAGRNAGIGGVAD